MERKDRRQKARTNSASSLSNRFRSLPDCQLPLPEEVLKIFLIEHTSYSLLKFKELSLERAKQFAVISTSVIDYDTVETGYKTQELSWPSRAT